LISENKNRKPFWGAGSFKVGKKKLKEKTRSRFLLILLNDQISGPAAKALIGDACQGLEENQKQSGEQLH